MTQGEMKSVSDLGSLRTAANRPIIYFDVPVSMHKYGVKRLGFVELSANEELMASKRSGMTPMALQGELTKEAVRFVDGKPVNTGDGSADFFLNSCHPKIRTLCSAAYQKIHNPEQEETKGFLASMETTAG